MEIDELESMIGRSEIDWVSDFEIAAEQYHDEHGAAAILPLIRLLGDNLPDEVNFAVIHIIERAQQSDYINTLIAFTAEASEQGAYCRDVMHFRVFNSADYLRAYAGALKAADSTVKEAVAAYLDRLGQDPRNQRFVTQISLLATVAKSG